MSSEYLSDKYIEKMKQKILENRDIKIILTLLVVFWRYGNARNSGSIGVNKLIEPSIIMNTRLNAYWLLKPSRFCLI